MSLHERIRSNGSTVAPDDSASAPAGAHSPAGQPRAQLRPQQQSMDPYAELKTRIHHACIAKLGPELFRQTETEDLS